jgi:hypothetical protein
MKECAKSNQASLKCLTMRSVSCWICLPKGVAPAAEPLRAVFVRVQLNGGKMEDDEDKDVKDADALTEKIIALLNERQVDHAVAMMAFTDLLITLLSNIQCKECRRLACERLSELVPDIIDEAMEAPGDATPGSHHIH